MQQNDWFLIFVIGMSCLGAMFPANWVMSRLGSTKWWTDGKWWQKAITALLLFPTFGVVVVSTIGMLVFLWAATCAIPLSILASYHSGWFAGLWLVVGFVVGVPVTDSMILKYQQIRDAGGRHEWKDIPFALFTAYVHMVFLVPLAVYSYRTIKSGHEITLGQRARNTQYFLWTGVRKNIPSRICIYYLSHTSSLRSLDLATFVKFQESAPLADQPTHWLIVKDDQHQDDRSIELITRKGHSSSWTCHSSPHNDSVKVGDGWQTSYRLSANDGEGLRKNFVVRCYTTDGLTEHMFGELITELLRYVGRFNNLRHEFNIVCEKQVAPLIGLGRTGNNPKLKAAHIFLDSGLGILSDSEGDFNLESLLLESDVRAA